MVESIAIARENVVEVVERWRAIICPEWHIVLMRKPPEDIDDGPDGELGHADMNPAYRFARVWINREAVVDDTDLEVTVVHELLHLQLSGVSEFVNELLAKLSIESAVMGRERKRLAEESAIESLARLIVRLSCREVPAVRWHARGQ